MTTTTDTVAVNATDERAPVARPSIRLRFGVAFVVGLVAVLALGAGVLYAYDQQYEGRILPGVRVGAVDLSGLSAAAARDRLNAAYANLATGELVLTGPSGPTSISYADLGRHVDAAALVASAAAIGHAGGPIERAIGNARTALRGVSIEPQVAFDKAALAARVRDVTSNVEVAPVDATVTLTKAGFTVAPGAVGRTTDPDAIYAAAANALSSLHAPARVEVAIPVAVAEPRLTTEEAEAAKGAADRIATNLNLTAGSDHWTLTAAQIRSWLRITPTVDGAYVPIVDIARVRAAVTAIAAKALTKPVNAAFLVGKGSKIVGVTAGHNGRKLDVAATTSLVVDTLRRRSDVPTASLAAAVTITKPNLTTEEAEKAAPLMKRIATWTTWFPISERNHFGANIWLPATFINGTVVGPGETFDFWRTVGPVTSSRGFGKGGAILNGKTDPQGAIGGGICSNSTTLFNAALRAGMDMRARRNHFYYIDRYPIGLDATVFISNGGSVQTMSWRNDTPYPVLIRGINTRSGSRGFVRYDIYSVPVGRRVVVSDPIVKNVTHASDSIQYTTTMPKGTSKRIESPVDGKDVWRTVSVYQDGKLIRQHTYYSHYSRVTGVVLVGTGGSSDTTDTTGSTPTP
ncbi:MAG TPA: VanW family protein [Candidatus Limnocylindrales bacterium]|nr:VanW family protein [Candidatus Limnocylindrales bacterium]